ncbi:Transglutaminase-like enzyme, putative cysteine protease [Catalinimonas alkaloidigena]|uniref:Transglutaminase-like enzyme, putative cysteine protease n=1 Tax=Catalinimonas alkaloidigena TaxID=1075417 RepID=A0A1G9SB63_9BACT|nr:transglutaminase family protein [Catalinimonas alkaloidigena]SDM32718.1 Transglutaminase-like enzyme, putative cysteine protease [Catalinimonas alkaloidigena]
MVTYHISYEAENHYDQVVQEALFSFLVIPCYDITQQVVAERIENSLDIPMYRSKNVFGFETLNCRVAQPFSDFKLQVTCTVSKDEKRIVLTGEESLPLEEERKIWQSSDFVVDHYLYIHQSDLTHLAADQIPPSFLYQGHQGLFEFATALNQGVYGMMEYAPGATTAQTKATDLLTQPTGVCQDYAHLMLGLLRHNQIPCRYVSGYLNQGQDFLGSAQMHAWVEVRIPKLGWVGFDPTNNRMADENHIKVADGIDYSDCSPLRGYIKPPGSNKTEHTVQVVVQQ